MDSVGEHEAVISPPPPTLVHSFPDTSIVADSEVLFSLPFLCVAVPLFLPLLYFICLSLPTIAPHFLDHPVVHYCLRGLDRYCHLLTSLPPFLPPLGFFLSFL